MNHASVDEQRASYTSIASEMERVAEGLGTSVARAELVHMARQYRELAARIVSSQRSTITS
jgi:hypothetical protein